MPSIRRTTLSAACAVALACSGTALAQNSAQTSPQASAPNTATAPADYIPGARIPQLQGEITIDGKLDEAAWQGALVQEIAYEINPGDNIAAPVKTTVRVGYTTDALYVSFHAIDPDPTSIRAHLRDRDTASMTIGSASSWIPSTINVVVMS